MKRDLRQLALDFARDVQRGNTFHGMKVELSRWSCPEVFLFPIHLEPIHDMYCSDTLFRHGEIPTFAEPISVDEIENKE
jgi:hypothetical protein